MSDNGETGWTLETLKEYVTVQLEDLRNMLQERYQMQTKAVDAAFSAQQLAMQTAKTEQLTAMTTALDAQKEAVQTAMAASDKASSKAETAADKRFESVNEFRKQLGDQADTFASKTDMNVRLDALSAKFDYESESLRAAGNSRERSLSDLELRLTRRLDLSQGQEKGEGDSRGNKRQDTAILISIGGLIIAVTTTIITVLSR